MAEITYHKKDSLGKPADELNGTMTLDVLDSEGNLKTRDIMENAVVSFQVELGHSVREIKFPREITCKAGETVRLTGLYSSLE